MSERDERSARLRIRQPGSWCTTSAAYFRLLEKVYRESEKADTEKVHDDWVQAGIPMLLSGVEAFLIEHQRFMGGGASHVKIAGVDPLKDVLALYPVPDDLRADMDALIEVRNQIIHPSPVPFGKSYWPDSLEHLRKRGVLDGRTPQSGTDVLAMLASHLLLKWAVEQCLALLNTVAASDDRDWWFSCLASNLGRVLGMPLKLPNSPSLRSSVGGHW